LLMQETGFFRFYFGFFLLTVMGMRPANTC